MAVKEIKSVEELTKAKTNGIALVDFSAPWCAPCRLQEPIISRIARQFEGRAFIAAVNIDENPDVASILGIRSIPTLIFFKNGKEFQRLVGLQSEVELSNSLKKLLE